MEFAPAFRAAGLLGVENAALKAGVVGRDVMRHTARTNPGKSRLIVSLDCGE